jgi:3-methyladenine DNA glycosylase AlkC
MAEPLKNMFFKREFFEKLSGQIMKVYPEFDKRKFLKLVFNKEWDKKELKQRMRHAANALHEVLPPDYKKSLGILINASSGFRGFDAMIFPDYVETYGIDDPESSVPALELFTKLCTSEFAVRPFIIKYPEFMIQQMRIWAKHKDPRVRRLASEGYRPRLPWAVALPEFKKDPSPIVPVVEMLIEDSEEFVRRSAANNLNDIAKDNPDITLNIAKKWLGKSPEADTVIKHALRTRLKSGDPEVLSLFGYKDKSNVLLKDFKVSPNVVKVGEKLNFSFMLVNTARGPLKLRIEYAIYYLKTRGKYSRKVFKITESTFKEKNISLKRSRSFADLTIRKHNPGKHKISIIVNGRELGIKEFILK